MYDITEYLPNVTIQLVVEAIVSIFLGLTNVVQYFEVPDGCVYFDYSGSVPPQEVPPPPPDNSPHELSAMCHGGPRPYEMSHCDNVLSNVFLCKVPQG